MTDEDPGWPISWRSVLMLFLPAVGMRRPPPGADALVMFRQVFLAFCAAIVMFGVVIATIYETSEPTPNPPTVWVAVALAWAAVGNLVVAPRIERPLDCADDGRLVATYRTRFFLRIAFGESAALFGFAGFFLTYAWWPYPVGAVITALGFVRAAPSKRNLARDQERLATAGCGRSLVAALRTAVPTS